MTSPSDSAALGAGPDSEASPVLLPQGPDQKRTFEFLVPHVLDGAGLLQFHAVDGMMRDLHTRRLAENKRLLEMEKAWEVRKSELEPQLKKMVTAAHASGQKSAQSMLASTFTKDREDSVDLGNEDDFIRWALRSNYPMAGIQVRECWQFETREDWKKAKDLILARAKAGLDIPPGVTITPAGQTVVTRQRATPRLSPQQILAQRGDLDRLTNQPLDDQENQDDNDYPSTGLL